MILLTGGLGYIGTHMAAELLTRGQPVVVVDSLVSNPLSQLARLQACVDRSVPFEQVDVRDRAALIEVMQRYAVDAVMHFAALKSPAESIVQPLQYFDQNVYGTVSLLEAMQHCGVRDVVFSSSAAVYGACAQLPITEHSPCQPLTPYGLSKKMAEEVLQAAASASPLRSVALRYFNPVGAHPSGLLGEPLDRAPGNLMPFILQVLRGQRERIEVFGEDYDTLDGTGVRDYIHVMDLVAGHWAALQWLRQQPTGCAEVFNLGRGAGYSVRQVIAAMEQVSGQSLQQVIQPRRPGDVAASFADTYKAQRLLNWRAEQDLHQMAQSLWHYVQVDAQRNRVQGKA